MFYLSKIGSEQILSFRISMKPFDERARKAERLVYGDRAERVPIPQHMALEVYKNANKGCQCCGRPLRKIGYGDFHHTETPTKNPNPSKLQFLCPTCHRIYGHTRKGRRIQRNTVRKIKSPYWKKAKTTKKSAKGKTKKVIKATRKKRR